MTRRLVCLFATAAIGQSSVPCTAAGPSSVPSAPAAVSRTSTSDPVDAFIGKTRSALERGNPRLLDRLVKSDRGAAYDAVDRLLAEDLRAADALIDALASSYDAASADRCLIERAATFRAWTPEQKARRAEAVALKTGAKQAMMEGRGEDAASAYQAALEIFHALGDLREEGRSRSNLGAVAAQRGESRAAIEHLDRALPIVRRAGDRNMLGTIELNRAYALEDLGDLEGALAAIDAALPIAREMRDLELEPRLLVNRGSVLLKIGRLEEAETAYLAAVETGERTGDFELLGTALFNLADFDRRRGDAPAQERRLKAAALAGRKGGIPPLEAEALLALAPLARRRGDFSEERRLLDACRAVISGTDDPMLRSSLEYHEALSLQARGRYEESLPFLAAAQRQLESLDSTSRMGTIIGARATALYYLGDYEGAVAQIHEALALARGGGRDDIEADTRAALGYFLSVMGDPSAGLAEFEEAARLYGRLGDEVSRGSALDAVGAFRFKAGDVEGSRDALEEALTLLPEDGQAMDRAETLKDLAMVELAAGAERRLRGRELLREAREIFTRIGDPLGISHANALEAQAALEDHDIPAAGKALARIQASPSARSSREYRWLIRYMEGRVAEAEGRATAAAAAYRRAIDEVERSRGASRPAAWRAAILADRIEPYRALVRLLRDTGRVEEAWRVARAAKARTFVESLLPPEAPPAPRENAEESGIVPASFDRRTSKAASPIDLAAPGAPRNPLAGSERLRSLLHDGETLIDFHMDGEDVTAFVLRDASLGVYPIRFDRAAAASLEATKWPGRPRPEDLSVLEAWRSATRSVAATLLEPLAKEIEGAREILFVPGGSLHGVPFAALPFRGRTLAERLPVSILPAAEALLSREVKRTGSGLLVLGDPAATGGGPRLPAAAEEAGLVAASSGLALPIVGANATESMFRRLAPAADRIHIAAHGRIDRVTPVRSHLALAPGGGFDGRLEVGEISTMRLGASLVVLSGCGTGVEGGLVRGDALADERAGLPRAFLSAGVGSVVAGLWEVEDAAALAMMPRLYPRMTGRSPAAALASLQADLAAGKIADAAGRPLDHPYYWAGLVAYGAGRGGSGLPAPAPVAELGR